MGEKSLQKKQYILENAREIFMDKGYKNVTMKDIVEKCEISRGGLYLYFNSTKEVFEDVLKLEVQETDDVFSDAIGEDATSMDILLLFFKEQKKELLRKKKNLTIAIYEFYFENKVAKKDNSIRRQFDVAVKIMQQLIEEGVANGEFFCDNPLAMARNIMFVIEGLKISSQTMGITEEMIDSEFGYIVQWLALEE
ncbi:MAG: TetR/AcrR family transcriptional regulator [Lachnospiraceae bacterium]|nr:TetR/AcrR family transcriptional regulator [Lachnospiraceae bacterium]MDD3660694.1 TetR/AcrR family transcriptional regulator [Lachnospiraceae bacterium]